MPKASNGGNKSTHKSGHKFFLDFVVVAESFAASNSIKQDFWCFPYAGFFNQWLGWSLAIFTRISYTLY